MAELESRLQQALQTRLRRHADILAAKTAKLWQHSPITTINHYQQRQEYLHQRLINANRRRLEQLGQRLFNASQTLHAVSPLATLNRGYALALLMPSGQIIRSSEQLRTGDLVQIQLARGQFTSQVKDIKQE